MEIKDNKMSPTSKICAARNCDTIFIPKQSNQKYCCVECRYNEIKLKYHDHKKTRKICSVPGCKNQVMKGNRFLCAQHYLNKQSDIDEEYQCHIETHRQCF